MLSKSDIELLDTISETSDMARSSIKMVIDKSDNTALQSILKQQHKVYNDIFEEVSKIMHYEDKKNKEAGTFAKLQSQFVGNMKTMTSENTSSTIAEMVIQGCTMGVTEVTKKLHEDVGANVEYRSIGEKLLVTLNTGIEEMKKFL